MNKIIEIFEKHIEKMVLGVVVLACLWLVFARVLLCPNKVEYNGEKLRPGEIDVEISREAGLLRQKLNERTKPPAPYEPCLPRFAALLESGIRNVDVSLSPPLPPLFVKDIRKDSIEYRLPFIGDVNDVASCYIRAAAYVPAVVIDEQNLYDKSRTEVNDIDFVTVEAKFDAAGLYERFYESFAGVEVQEEWRDPCLAKPVFAAVQLQRQELRNDGTRSEWQDVPRSRIDAYRKTFKTIEDVRELPPGGMKVRMLQYDSQAIRMALLQPEGYKIASAEEEWLPPTLHKEYLEQRRQEELEAKREAAEEAKEEREKEREEKLQDRRGRTTDTRTRTGTSDGRYGGYGTEGGLYGSNRTSTRRTTRRDRELYPGDTTTDTRRTRYGERTTRRRYGEEDTRLTARGGEALKEQSTNDVYSKFNEILITTTTEFAKMREPLVFWAHDDTVEPRKSYRYRIRLGVFNPIAGTNHLSDIDQSRKNDVILWSEFSNMTELIEIPGRSYFFANDIQEAAKTVTVEVCKYALGYWYSEKFPVKQGEVIGRIKRVELSSEEQEEDITVPEIIDYDTGAVFVDVTFVSDWSGGSKLAARGYYDMLYSYDGMNIEHMPIKTMYWSKEQQVTFSDIQRSLRQTKQPFRDWSSGSMRRGPYDRAGYYDDVISRDRVRR